MINNFSNAKKLNRNGVCYSEMKAQSSNRREYHTFFHSKILSVQILSSNLHPINMARKGQLTITLQFAYIQSWNQIPSIIVKIVYSIFWILKFRSELYLILCENNFTATVVFWNMVVTSSYVFTFFYSVINGWAAYWFITIKSEMNGPMY